MKDLITTHVIGSITTHPGTKLRLTDPCYSKNHPNQGLCDGTDGVAVLDNIQPGNWTVLITIEDAHVAKLAVLHLKHTPFEKSLHTQPLEELFVDSGQFGIFDDSLYPSGLDTGDYGDPTSFYGRACADREWAAILPEGVVCDADYGDGSYRGRYMTTDGMVTYIEVTFIDEEAEDEDSA